MRTASTPAPDDGATRSTVRRVLLAFLVTTIVSVSASVLLASASASASTARMGALSAGAGTSLDHFVGTFILNGEHHPEQFWVDGNEVWHTYWTGTEWSPGSGLGGPASGVASTTVSAELNEHDDAELYVIGADGDVYHSYSTPGTGSGWSSWDSMSKPAGLSIGGQISAGRNYLGNQELYVLASDGNVYHDFATPGRGSGWAGWSGLGAPGASIAGDVHAGRNNAGNQELFAVGADGAVYHDYSTPGVGSGWSGWSPLGSPPGGPESDIAVWQNWQDNEELFLIGDDRQLWHAVATPGVGSGWSGWSTLASAPGVALTNFVGLYQGALIGELVVWVRATDGAFWSIHLSQTAAGQDWSAWSTTPSSNPAPEPLPDPPPDQSACAAMTGQSAVIARQEQIAYLCNGPILARTMPFTANNTQPSAGTYRVYARVATTTSSEGQCARGCILRNFLPFTRGRFGGRIGFHLDPILRGTEQYVEPPDQIGTEATRGDSAGCFRLRPEDSAATWQFLSIGSVVLVV